MLKIKKLNTESPQIKHCPCPNYEDMQTRLVQFTDQKKIARTITMN